jgi:hypothetical protein
VYEIPPAESPAGRRPISVTAAGYLLFGAAALILATGILPLPYADQVAYTAKRAYANIDNGDTIASAVAVSVYGTSVAYIVAGIGLAVLGWFDLRGSKGARITTWVIGGIAVVCCGSGTLIGRVASGVGSQNANNTDPALSEAQKQVEAVYPSWYSPVTTTLVVTALLALIVALILLALPASHPYFGQARPGGPTVPGYPGIGEPPLPPLPPQPGGGNEPPTPPSQR